MWCCHVAVFKFRVDKLFQHRPHLSCYWLQCNYAMCFLYTQEVDMMVAPLSRQTLRELYMDFADVSFYLEFTTIAMRKPDPDGHTISLFFQPFKLEMWGCIVGAAPLIGIVLWLFTCAHSAIWTQTKMGTMGKIADALWFSYGAMFNQGEV